MGGCFSELLLLVLPLWFLPNKGATQFRSLSALEGAGVLLTSSTDKGRLPRMLGQQCSPPWGGLWDLSRLLFSSSLSSPCKPWSAQDRKSLQLTRRQSDALPSSCCTLLQALVPPGPPSLLPHAPQPCISTPSAFIQPLHSSVSPSSLTVSRACSTAGSPQLATVAAPAHTATLSPSLPSSSPLTLQFHFSISLCPTQTHWAVVPTSSSRENNARFSAPLYPSLSRNSPSTPTEKRSSPRFTQDRTKNIAFLRAWANRCLLLPKKLLPHPKDKWKELPSPKHSALGG